MVLGVTAQSLTVFVLLEAVSLGRCLECDFSSGGLKMFRELAGLGIAIAALSEVRSPGTGKINVGGYTSYWSGHADGCYTEGLVLAVTN